MTRQINTHDTTSKPIKKSRNRHHQARSFRRWQHVHRKKLNKAVRICVCICVCEVVEPAANASVICDGFRGHLRQYGRPHRATTPSVSSSCWCDDECCTRRSPRRQRMSETVSQQSLELQFRTAWRQRFRQGHRSRSIIVYPLLTLLVGGIGGRGHFRSRDKDGGRTIRSAIAETPWRLRVQLAYSDYRFTQKATKTGQIVHTYKMLSYRTETALQGAL